MSPTSRVLVIGTSSGGHAALAELLSQLPANLNAAVLVVLHMPSNYPKGLAERLQRKCAIKITVAIEGEEIQSGTVYICVPDHHLLLHGNQIELTTGPKENMFRPSVDATCRSAAVAFKHRTVGLVLTGRLSDGVAGLQAIKACGGIIMVQDPEEAEYADMPTNVVQYCEPDYVMDIKGLSQKIAELVEAPLPPKKEIPIDLIWEAEIPSMFKSDVPLENAIGNPAPYGCPECGGPLWEMKHSKPERFRCHVGHSYSIDALSHEQDIKIEESLWVALRMLEERVKLLQKMKNEHSSKNLHQLAESYQTKLDEAQDHANRIRSFIREALTSRSNYLQESLSSASA